MKTTNPIYQDNFQKKLIVSIGFAIVVYLTLSLWGNLGNLKTALSNFNMYLLVPMLCLATLNFLIRFAKWQYYLSSLDIRIKRFESLLIFLSGFSLAITPGKIGEIIRSYFIKITHQVPVSKTAPIIFADRLTDLIGLLVISGIGVVSYKYGAYVIGGVGLVVITMLFFVSQKTYLMKILLKTKNSKLINAYESSCRLLNLKSLIVAIPLSVIAWFCEAIVLYLTYRALGLQVGFQIAIFIYSFSMIIGAISMLPGGLGLTEGSIASLSILAKMSKSQAAVATLVVRVVTLWYAIIIGLVAMFLFQRYILKNNNYQ